MGAFIVAGIVFIATVGISFIMIFAAGMSDNPSASQEVGRQALGTFLTGCVIAGIIAGTHWMPSIGW